jgi:hypothetical protein
MSLIPDTVGLYTFLFAVTDRGEHGEEARVHVRVGDVVGAREQLLDVRLLRNVRSGLLEHDVMQRELLAHGPNLVAPRVLWAVVHR